MQPQNDLLNIRLPHLLKFHLPKSPAAFSRSQHLRKANGERNHGRHVGLCTKGRRRELRSMRFYHLVTWCQYRSRTSERCRTWTAMKEAQGKWVSLRCPFATIPQ